MVQEALAALQNRWTTYRNTFAATPIAVIRAILLDALVNAAAEDDRVGVCFIASARNALPLLPVDNERDIWIGIVEQVERRVDARAEEEWATPETISVQPMKYQVPTLTVPDVKIGEASQTDLQNGMTAPLAHRLTTLSKVASRQVAIRTGRNSNSSGSTNSGSGPGRRSPPRSTPPCPRSKSASRTWPSLSASWPQRFPATLTTR